MQVTQGAACSYEISPDRQTFARNGGNGAVIVSAPAGCDWTVDIDAEFVTLEPGSKDGGSGPGAVRYQVAPHVGTETRIGTLTIADSTFTIEQLAVELAAAFGFSPEEPGVGESITFFDQSVGNPDVWRWDFRDGTPVDSGPTVTHVYTKPGVYMVLLEVGRADPLIPLSASKEQAVTISAAGGSSTCVFEISPRLESFGPEGGTRSVAVTTSAECAWTARSRAPFVTLSEAGGTGSRTIEFNAEENGGAEPRAGVLVVAGQLFLVEQEGKGSCTYVVSVEGGPLEGGPFGPQGGVGLIVVSTQEECPWLITTEDKDREIFQLASSVLGKSSARLQFCLAANRKGPREVKVHVVDEVLLKLEQEGREDGKPEGECTADATTLCLVDGRVELRAAFRNLDGRSAAAQVRSVSSKAGFFSFFSTSTLELLTKVVDGRPLNGYFWLFQGALSDVAYAVTATDVETGSVRLLCNPAGTLRSRVDTQALPASPD